MARTAIGVAIGILFVAAVIWGALSSSKVQCEICVDYKGRSACSTAAAADRAQAQAQAQSGACSQVAGGVTETLECAAIQPTLRRCSE
jgi:hypothetical protein